MASLLVDYRSDVYNMVAGAADASRWTNALLDQSLRLALGEINQQLVYETSFTVTVAGYEQDMSGITALFQVLAAAYPWVNGAEFGDCAVEFRFSGVNKLYFINAQPSVNDVIRLRHTKLHTIQNLDAAGATTVPDAHRNTVGLLAAAAALEMRLRQTGEPHLAEAGARLRVRAQEALSHVPALGRLRWGNLGMG